jgi:CRP/FNR family cyclic AMP-dependent transcriptional regulator
MLKDAERRWLHDRGASRVYPAGYIMTMEGEPAENVLVLMHGLATAACVTESGAEMILRVYGPGDVISGEAVLSRRPRQETVEALTVCSALVIPAGQFADLHRSAGIAGAFGVAMTHLVQDADMRARTRLALPRVQVTRVLLDLAARVGNRHDDGSIYIPVDLSQETLAKWIVASRSTVARVLAELRGLEVIRTMYRTIIITDPARMADIAGIPGGRALVPAPARMAVERPAGAEGE